MPNRYSPEEMRSIIRNDIGGAHGDQLKWCRKHKVHSGSLHRFLSGKTDVVPIQILRALKMRRMPMYEFIVRGT